MEAVTGRKFSLIWLIPSGFLDMGRDLGKKLIERRLLNFITLCAYGKNK
jgi:hypothetical protein